MTPPASTSSSSAAVSSSERRTTCGEGKRPSSAGRALASAMIPSRLRTSDAGFDQGCLPFELIRLCYGELAVGQVGVDHPDELAEFGAGGHQVACSNEVCGVPERRDKARRNPPG